MFANLFIPEINTVLIDEDDESFVANTDGIQIEDVEEDTDVTFLVPHSDASALTALVCALYMTRILI
jgi:hypothetical protein